MSDFIIPTRAQSDARLRRGYSRLAGFARDKRYTVADRFEERANDSAAIPFILFEDHAISYAEADLFANRVANAAMQAGLGPGDVVALMMFNRPEFLLTWIGLSKIGVVAALINTSTTGAALAHALREVEATALIVDTPLVPAVAALDAAALPRLIFEDSEAGIAKQGHPGWIDFNQRLEAASDRRPDREHRAHLVMGDPLYYIFTSGTTGLPKAARMSHLRFFNAGEMMAGLLDFGDDGVIYDFLPLFHGAGGMVVPSVAMAEGRPLLLRRKFSRTEFWNDIRRHHVTATYYIGEIVRYLLAAPPRPDDRDHTLRAMCGAGLRADHWRAFIDRFGVADIIEGLGATEGNYSLSNADNRIGSVGRLPYPDATNIRVLKWDMEAGDHARDAAGKPLLARPGEVGELIAEVLDGTGIAGYFEGYTNRAASEAKLLRDLFRRGDAWFRSGDLVRFDADDYFFFVDRLGDTFRWKSENVSTQEVEAALGRFAGPEMVNVYGVHVPGAEGRAGMAALTYADPAHFDPAAFYQHCEGELAPYAVPVFVRIGVTADLTATFKLRKVDLQRQGYDPAAVGTDRLYIADPAGQTYVPLTPDTLARLAFPPFERDAA